MSAPIITLIGGGVWLPQMFEAFAEAWPTAPRLQWRLVARRPDRLAHIAQNCRAFAPTSWRIKASTDRCAALKDATVVILLARIGGFAARAHDEAFPQAFGVAGDEGLGPGGLANAWRTVPWLDALAPEIPSTAQVFNMMAPLGITTQALVDRGCQTVGVCELPSVTRAVLGGGGRYAGLNHLGWFWDMPQTPGLHPLKYLARVFGDVLPQLGRAAELANLSEQALADPQRASARAMPWFRDALVPALRAHLGGPAWEGFVNLPNAGWITELPPNHVVELAARWTTAVTPVAPGPLPTAIVPFLQAIAGSEVLGLQAARDQDPTQMRAAMAALPLSLSAAAIDGLTAAATQPVSILGATV